MLEWGCECVHVSETGCSSVQVCQYGYVCERRLALLYMNVCQSGSVNMYVCMCERNECSPMHLYACVHVCL